MGRKRRVLNPTTHIHLVDIVFILVPVLAIDDKRRNIYLREFGARLKLFEGDNSPIHLEISCQVE